MKKVLVTGANGLLGANVVRQLDVSGYRAIAMVRKGSNREALKGANYDLFEGDIANEQDVNAAIQKCEYVIHCAAKTSQVPSHLDNYVKTNIIATKTIIAACLKFNIKRFIFVSTANCFTNGTIENPGNESSKFMPWLKDSGYAYSKFLAQSEVLSAFKTLDLPAIVVNPTFMIGPYDAQTSSGKLLLYAHNNKIVFYPPGGKSFVDVEYAAKAICNALTEGKVGESYLLAGKNMTYKDFFRLIAKQTARRKILIPIPSFLLSTIGKMSDLMEYLFSISLALNTVNAKLLSLDNYFSNKKAMSELKLKETNLDDAVSKAVDWFKQNGFIRDLT
ncbi:MAG: NAD-dependent epimerase/dehydratase family protein [Bacteroidales bacterium]|jgi:dihydroflavonol-4-reductase|nr:NAD-dependent epimerase/dehydratase family protein [Bacteroidales bacterium]